MNLIYRFYVENCINNSLVIRPCYKDRILFAVLIWCGIANEIYPILSNSTLPISTLWKFFNFSNFKIKMEMVFKQYLKPVENYLKMVYHKLLFSKIWHSNVYIYIYSCLYTNVILNTFKRFILNCSYNVFSNAFLVISPDLYSIHACLSLFLFILYFWEFKRY